MLLLQFPWSNTQSTSVGPSVCGELSANSTWVEACLNIYIAIFSKTFYVQFIPKKSYM